MTYQEIRKKFLDFFEKQGHKIMPSSLLIPEDQSVLFTSAGMQQFKKYYLDSTSPCGNRVSSIQKCLRTVDINEVGDESHLTFFEMLGNFSFNFPEGEASYFKEEAIRFGYELIVKDFNIPLERIKISVFRGDLKNNVPEDRESLEIWKSFGISEDRIFFGDIKDNFWGPTGSNGPCGPTTEIHIDGIEIWNIVFNEYLSDVSRDGLLNGSAKLLPLRRKGVDTGMGLERLILVLQNQESVFETDLFIPIITELRGKNLYDYKSNQRSERIIADHLKASVFVISDGVMPSNIERGYILRRLIRKIMRHSEKLNLPQDFLQRSLETIINIYKEYYPELNKNKEKILNIFNEEFQKFGKALDKGTKEFEKGIIEFKSNGIIPGPYAFNIQQSMGVTFDIMEDIAKGKGMKIDIDGFKEEEKKHKEISKISQEKKFRR
ncbi:MAG: hypothetical protein A2913_02245 [Parcubacteria group bacterium RIFCSPLOWO2_01_FULL_40_65]|nr:MAG: hypothetical protein A2734_01730 [Parcubacteria group bacterium RIFCSPHIGHO2_01_FULL_40_30]OHB19165.1 MAG: hypothetical protein A3D40_01425 [Parcubacteria group bacterium RIFCSPHIGHO2_02_FULL_40_12]OHB21325.1 MAG: hypothetical protein A2913_02245 [Parcubacteria group bacterium RIFCSPLOWO2_01_FULL_40_65]OHB23192.1 MAG: hypothetical protein A3I22_02090 [Parcubacteria group bacterium RIFCSPLOWO2_02_FULL_40_12]OHB23785.1 MAG: hypothetical protein A3F96_01450 [Parcubacteria group bacterium R